MATSTELAASRRPLIDGKPSGSLSVCVRVAEPEASQLLSHLFVRYPSKEWATFLRLGWRATSDSLLLTIAEIDGPLDGDLNSAVSHVAIDEKYSLRAALRAESHSLAVGIAHSHPENCKPLASRIDDEMDSYYSAYFGQFAPHRPYVSLIASRIDGRLRLTGRVFWEASWHHVSHFVVQTDAHGIIVERPADAPVGAWRERSARLRSAFGDEAERRLRSATVGVLGAGGTGSAAIEVLARAGVGRLIVVDPDHLDESNLERVHGSVPADAREQTPKALLAKRHIEAIDPECRVQAITGALPQVDVVNALTQADVAIGCTDQQHGRVALSDMAVRYLLPAIDCGVGLEGKSGVVRGQIVQLVRFHPADACVLCRDMLNPQQLARELMSDEERHARRTAAQAARSRGENANPYWQDIPQLNTVGYLTTVAGALAAAYVIGWLTGRFDAPFSRLQLNLVAREFDVTNNEQQARKACVCRRVRGWADQAIADAMISAPRHWPSPTSYSTN